MKREEWAKEVGIDAVKCYAKANVVKEVVKPICELVLKIGKISIKTYDHTNKDALKAALQVLQELGLC